MKKSLRILTITAILAAVVLIAACKQFLADPEEFFSYWAAEVIGTDSVIDKPTQAIGGVLCVPSADDVTVTIKLKNPKNFRLVTPNSPSPDAGRVITFPGLSPQPTYTTHYTLSQTANDKLALTYKPAFLKAHEWSDGDISPEITLVSTDGRTFNKKFRLNLKVNTAPVLEYAGIGKTAMPDSSGNHFYVLLFRVKDMDSTITAGSIHKDIKKLIVTAGGVPSEIPLSLNTGDTDFPTGGDLLAAGAVQKLKPGDPELPSPTAQDWILRLKTDVKVGGPEKEYEVCIKDEQGLSSALIPARTKKNKLADVALLDSSTPITGTTAGNPKECAGMSGKILTAQAAAGAAITGTVSRFSSSPDNWTQTGTVSGTTSAAINLPALDASETQVLYKISLKAQLSGYDDSDSKEFFIKLVRYEVPVLKLKQDFSSSDNNLHCISAGTKAYVTEDIIPDAGQYNNSSKALLIYTASSSNFKLELSASAGTAVKYQLDTNPVQSPSAPAEITLTGGTVYTLEVWAERGGIPGPHTTVHIKGIATLNTYSELKNVVQNAPEKGTGQGQYDYSRNIDIKIGGDLNASSADTEIAVTGGKDLMLSGSPFGTVRTVDAGGLGRILKISDSDTELTLSNIKLTGGYAADGKGGAVCVETGCSLWLYGKTVITPSTGSDINTPGKNDVFLKNDAKITVDSVLTGTAPVARITVPNNKYLPTTQVLTADSGVTLENETYKFAVTPQTSPTPQEWTVGGNGCLKEGRYTEVPYGQLETYLANASSTEVNYIEVTGISAADLTGSYGSPPDPGALGQKIKNNSAKKVALKLPSGLSSTDMRACFSQCENLVSLENFPSGVTDMRACFYMCGNLTTVPDIPASVTDMNECFRYCRSLTTALNIPAGVYDMSRCFQYCEKLQSIKMNCPYGVNFNGAFSGCDALPNGGIQVPSTELGTYKANAGTMGTTPDKFVGF